jgi:hypothetical protein
MNDIRSRRLAMPRLQALLLGATVIFGAAACVAHLKHGLDEGDGPPQGWNKSRGPVIPHDTFPKDCSLCHVSTSWTEIRKDFSFDHEKETGVALVGAHAKAECLRCHNDRGPVATYAQRGCSGCHEDIHRGKLGKGCEDCHEQTDWSPNAQVARHNRTRFPLVGAHAAVGCFRCHPGAQVGNFDRTDISCVSCHSADLAQATNPDHQVQGWTHDCQDCHIPTTWTGAGFNHAGFPLTGAHRTLACNQCHAGGVYQGLSTACFSCHQNDWDNTTNPPHAASGFPTTCQTCHTTVSWQGATFNHTWFPINSGHHAGIACIQCHTNSSDYSIFACINCHTHDQASTDPQHSRVPGYSYNSAACYSCHPHG